MTRVHTPSQRRRHRALCLRGRHHPPWPHHGCSNAVEALRRQGRHHRVSRMPGLHMCSSGELACPPCRPPKPPPNSQWIGSGTLVKQGSEAGQPADVPPGSYTFIHCYSGCECKGEAGCQGRLQAAGRSGVEEEAGFFSLPSAPTLLHRRVARQCQRERAGQLRQPLPPSALKTPCGRCGGEAARGAAARCGRRGRSRLSHPAPRMHIKPYCLAEHPRLRCAPSRHPLHPATLASSYPCVHSLPACPLIEPSM